MIDVLIHYIFSFRFLNFVWMVVVVGYAFKRWALPSLYDALLQKQKMVQAIFESITVLQENEAQKQKIIAEHELLQQELQKKIALWRTIVDQKHAINVQEKIKHLQAFSVYKQEQYYAFDLLMVQKDLEKSVLDSLFHTVQTTFQTSEQQHDFLKISLMKLQKDTHE